MSEQETIETFTTTTKRHIRTFYDNRCTFCLAKLTEEGCQCAHILDASRKGESQYVAICSRLGIIPDDYMRNSEANATLLCGSCHQGFFAYDYIALCPPKEVLEYLVKYVEDTPAGEQIPLYQVLYELTAPDPRGIPDPSAVTPYIGLYTVVHLRAAQLRSLTISTSFLPPLSILRNGQWEPAPTRTAPTAPNVARIFDALAVNTSDQHMSPGLIPLHPDQPNYSHRRYWRLPKRTLGGILSAVVLRAINSPSTADDELGMVRVLHSVLTLRNRGSVGAELSGDGSAGPSGGRGGGDGRRGGKGKGKGGDRGARTSQKRPPEGDGRTMSSNKRPRVRSSKRSHVHFSAIAERNRKSSSSQYDPANWAFGPEQSTNTIVYQTADTILDPAYFHTWVRR